MKYAGVQYDETLGLWGASAKRDGYAQHLGYYKTEERAAEAVWVRLGGGIETDAAGYDREQDQRWERVAGSDFFPDDEFLPTRSAAGDGPGRADRAANSPLDAPAFLPAGASTSSS